MAIIPNLRTRGIRGQAYVPPEPRAYIDTLFDYATFADALASSPIGKLTGGQASSPIAIIGTGLAGLTAAYELLRAGATNITLFEASNRSGGRTYSAVFNVSEPEYIAELGAMRFPPTEFALFHYLNTFGIPVTGDFPDPGIVDTTISYQGQTYSWVAGNPPPSIFDTVYAGWNAFVTNGATVGGVTLAPPDTISDLLTQGNLAAANAAWQTYIDVFENESFYSGLFKIFNGPNPPGNTNWQHPADYQLFGALGLGSGGFGPLYPLGFLELVRMIIDGLETDQQFVPGGIESLATAFEQASFNGVPLGNLIKLSAPVTGVSVDSGAGVVVLTVNGTTQKFARAIVATSHRSAQISIGLAPGAPVSAQTYGALTELHSASSSKVIVMTKNKFWLTSPGLPANIQTDKLVRGVYFLDYSPGNPANPGVVILSYTWEDDSVKLLGLQDPQALVTRLLQDVALINPNYASQIVPINGDYSTYVKVIAWENEPYQYGAFKFNFPGDDILTQGLYYNYLLVNNPSTDPYLYFAGESYSFHGGWTEGAITTGLNAATAVIKSLGGTLLISPNPLTDPGPGYTY